MTIGYLYDEAQRVGLIVWVGTVTADDWRDQVGQRIADPTVATAGRLLGDVRLATLDESVDAGVIGEIAQLWATSGVFAGKPVAIVAQDAFWDARSFEKALSQHGETVIVFNDLDTACTWLGVDLSSTREHLGQMAAALGKGVE